MTGSERFVQRQNTDRDPSLLFRATFTRHAHKESADPHKDGQVSRSRLSERGRGAARARGTTYNPDKMYASTFERSTETARAIGDGSQESGKDKVGETRVRPELDPAHFSPGFIKEYRSRFSPLPRDFDELGADAQEVYMEQAEAPAMNHWLSLWDKKFDTETESAKEVAERVAHWLVHLSEVYERLQGKRRANSAAAAKPLPETEHIIHRTVIEPLLRACVVLPQERLAEGSQPLQPFENGAITTRKNAGDKSADVELHGNRFMLDWTTVEKLSGEYDQRIANAQPGNL